MFLLSEAKLGDDAPADGDSATDSFAARIFRDTTLLTPLFFI